MSNVQEYKDLIAFHPGYYINEIIEDLSISQAEFAVRVGTTAKTISKLVNGKENLSRDIAENLAVMLGTSVDVWLDLQAKYEEKIAEINIQKKLDEQEIIAKKLDYAYFVRVAGLPKTTKIKEKIAHLCNYFKISNLSILEQDDFLVNYRISGGSAKQGKNMINAKAWLQTAINCSQKQDVEVFDENKLKEYLPQIRAMTMQDEKEFIPKLSEILTECGVAFFILPYLKNSGVNGAVKWFGHKRVMLAVSDRGKYSDIFWFSLFHEIGHVLQMKIKKTFVSYNDMDKVNDELEKEADHFSCEFLIPHNEYEKFIDLANYNILSVTQFAKRIGIHPGIVVGRLQHDKIISPEQLNELKTKYSLTA